MVHVSASTFHPLSASRAITFVSGKLKPFRPWPWPSKVPTASSTSTANSFVTFHCLVRCLRALYLASFWLFFRCVVDGGSEFKLYCWDCPSALLPVLDWISLQLWFWWWSQENDNEESLTKSPPWPSNSRRVKASKQLSDGRNTKSKCAQKRR